MNNALLKPMLLLAVFVFMAAPARAEYGVDDMFKDAIGKLLNGDKSQQGDDRNANRQGGEKREQVRVPASRAEVQLSFAPVVKKVAHSVVNVYAARRQTQRSPFEGDPFFERFFGSGVFGQPQQRNQNSLGSGVIVSADGVILTNNHVIENMDEVKVALSDGREFECDIVLKDPKSDLAVLKVRDKTRFDPIEIADSDDVEVGDLVLAIGNPFGVGQTVTSGIVSAVSRSLAGVNDYGYFIQTDAAINPGNSGGALVDMNGRLIGINSAIYSRTGSSVGIGYAIPSNMTNVVLRSSKTGATVVRPWIGADFQNVTAEIAESIGMRRPRGAIVTGVVENGPSDKAGLKVGDVVLEINNRDIDGADALGYRLDTVGTGGIAELTVLSRGKRRTIDISLSAPPETVPRDERVLPRNSPLLGAKVANLSPAVAVEAGIPGDKTGVVVLDVQRGSPAAQNGMRPGDVMREVNGVKIKDTRQLEQVVTQRQRAWQFVVERSGRMFVFERNGPIFRQYAQ
ncbi:MAG: DegQ family serine endoprotease [Nitratireductor sp.]|nr:DegQ family serine endoprotease [Nitratireductor sp.]